MWTGRIICTLIGLLFSPLGALIGFFIGWKFIDKPKIEAAQRAQQTREAFSYHRGASSSNEILELTFAFMGYVARGAGRINEDHIGKAQSYMDMMGLDSAGRARAAKCFEQGKSESFDPQPMINRLLRVSEGNVSILSFFMEVQIQIALADGMLAPGESERLMLIGRLLGFSPEQIKTLINIRFSEMRFEQQFRQQYRQSSSSSSSSSSGYGSQGSYGGGSSYRESGSSYRERSGGYAGSSDDDLTHAYEILGVSPNDSFEDIKKAHKRLMLKYHPDRLASQGLPPEMIKLYTQKAQDIQAAFDMIKKARGEK